jgi:hypothetical protein
MVVVALSFSSAWADLKVGATSANISNALNQSEDIIS